MIDNNQLDEAHKVGDKVVIKHPSKDIKGKSGRIGEIRKGLYKGAPKTFTVDYDHNETTGQAKSVQLKSKHIQGVKEQVENLQEKHRVAITLSDPRHPTVTKRKELIQKTVRVNADNPGHAVDSAIHHFRKAGYKVHDHNYIGTIKEGNMFTFKELDESSALERFRKAAAEREKEANKREAEMKARHAAGKEDMKGAIDTLASRFKTEATDLRAQLQKHSDAAIAANKAGDDEKVKLHQNKMNAIKDKMAKQARNEEVVNESAPFKKLDHAVAYATDKVKTHRDNLDGIEVYKHKSGGYDVNHTMNSSGRDSLHKSGAKHLGTVYKDKTSNIKEDLEEGTFKYHMDKAVAAHDRGDVNRKKFHLSNAKQARYSLKSTEITKHKDLLDKYKSMTEGTNLEEGRGEADKHWDIAQGHKEKASLSTKGSEKYHSHMADYHDSMHRYHSDIGQSSHASAHADKAEIHHEKAYEASRTKSEEVAANNVGGGNIAGTQGDAGKKAVMTKKPMKRQTFKEFNVELTADQQFDLIEDLIQSLAEKNNVDSDEVWDSLESIDDEELFEYAIDAKGHKSSTGGLTQKGVDAYNRKTGGNLKTAVTTKPSKLKPGSKAANRRKSFCARMGGMKKRLTSAKTANDPDSRINKALRKWNC